MTSQVTRGLLIAAFCGVTTLAYASWLRPAAVVVGSEGLDYCQTPVTRSLTTSSTGSQDLLLFLFGMTQTHNR